MTNLANLRALICALGLAAASATAADASEVLYDATAFLVGHQAFQDSFSVDGPGTLTVTLSNFAWPVALANLDLIVSTPSGLLGPEMGAGTSTFEVTTGGTITAQWFGTAQGLLNAGTYGLEIQWAPTVPVTLPASIALLLSGLVLLVWQNRRHESMEAAVRAN